MSVLPQVLGNDVCNPQFYSMKNILPSTFSVSFINTILKVFAYIKDNYFGLQNEYIIHILELLGKYAHTHTHTYVHISHTRTHARTHYTHNIPPGVDNNERMLLYTEQVRIR